MFRKKSTKCQKHRATDNVVRTYWGIARFAQPIGREPAQRIVWAVVRQYFARQCLVVRFQTRWSCTFSEVFRAFATRILVGVHHDGVVDFASASVFALAVLS